jgi:hypothetical protein
MTKQSFLDDVRIYSPVRPILGVRHIGLVHCNPSLIGYIMKVTPPISVCGVSTWYQTNHRSILPLPLLPAPAPLPPAARPPHHQAPRAATTCSPARVAGIVGRASSRHHARPARRPLRATPIPAQSRTHLARPRAVSVSAPHDFRAATTRTPRRRL